MESSHGWNMAAWHDKHLYNNSDLNNIQSIFKHHMVSQDMMTKLKHIVELHAPVYSQKRHC
jgi:hypothetical protein